MGYVQNNEGKKANGTREESVYKMHSGVPRLVVVLCSDMTRCVRRDSLTNIINFRFVQRALFALSFADNNVHLFYSRSLRSVLNSLSPFL